MNLPVIGLPVIGLLGGTFNPIHNGHLYLAETLLNGFEMQEIRFIPSAQPPLKAQPEISAEHRAAMVQLAIEHNPKFKLDLRELQRNQKSYTIDSLIELRKELGNSVSLCWILGSDAFASIEQWHRWQELLDYCHLIVITRHIENGKHAIINTPKSWVNKIALQKQRLQTTPHGAIFQQEINAPIISSTQLREKLKQQKTVTDLTPKAVVDYITQHQLYQ